MCYLLHIWLELANINCQKTLVGNQYIWAMGKLILKFEQANTGKTLNTIHQLIIFLIETIQKTMSCGLTTISIRIIANRVHA